MMSSITRITAAALLGAALLTPGVMGWGQSDSLDDKIKTLVRTRPVSDDVPEAENLLDGATLDVRQRGLERLEVSMNVRNDRKHRNPNATRSLYP